MSSLLTLCLLFLISPVAALLPISVKGTKLYDNDGNQFFIKGVAYVTGNDNSDPLVDTKQCQADAPLMKKAGINTVYVYTVDTKQDHDGCMKVLADNGIYVWLQLADFPRTTGPAQRGSQWTLSVYGAFTEAMDAFAMYDNVLAFGIGQETITDNSTSTLSAPSLKAAARDLHAFRIARGYRPIPLSYSVADVASFRLLTAEYLTCDSPTTSIDLLGLNIFLRCSEPDWRSLLTQFSTLNLPIPVVISETGCRSTDQGGRNFTDVALLLGDDKFREVFSGVSVYEWTMHKVPYGIVEYPGGNNTGEPSALPQWSTLSSVLSAVATATGTRMAEYTPGNMAPPACPTEDKTAGWLVDGKAPLPTIEGLQMGTVTLRETVTQPGGSRATEGVVGQVADGGGLAAGAIAGIVIGGVLGLIILATAVFFCLRKRRRGANDSPEHEHERPPSYTYPVGKAELPTHSMAAAEMDGSPQSSTSSNGMWKVAVQEPREDSPTVTELPEKRWRRTTLYEVEEHILGHLAETGSGTGTGNWQVSPLSPGGRDIR
ncbi:hypothetical protein VTI74DRAFT_1225 [Chaetomium olivicolor]